MALVIEYEGTRYHGFQQQANLPTIQGYLEKAIAYVANHPIQTVCAGRTDAGVHARHQVIHFDTQADRNERAWILGGNSQLPPDIRIMNAKQVPTDFHARFSALSRTYCYRLTSQMVRPALHRNLVTWYPYLLNLSKMQTAANDLVGEHDFSAFRSSLCQSTTPIRHLKALRINKKNDSIFFTIQANAFLHHMVRNIIGVLIEIGREKKPTHWAQEVLESRNRALAGVKMPATGLCLIGVTYPIHYPKIGT